MNIKWLAWSDPRGRMIITYKYQGVSMVKPQKQAGGFTKVHESARFQGRVPFSGAQSRPNCQRTRPTSPAL